MMYRQHQAPFIIVSGGRVHPYHTPYNEAFEMKKYLMDVWQIPESAIIIEPHARHTTTNFRNAARIMFRNGFPVTLSKILCKWKQDSVVSLFLYLNSVFKHKHKLIHNQAPV